MKSSYKLIKRRDLRKKSTYPEKILWDKLKNRQMIGYKFRRQHSIGSYILDFYCIELKLCIELDGENHFNFHGKIQDQIRADYLSDFGIKIVRFENFKVIGSLNEVINLLKFEILKLTT